MNINKLITESLNQYLIENGKNYKSYTRYKLINFNTKEEFMCIKNNVEGYNYYSSISDKEINKDEKYYQVVHNPTRIVQYYKYMNKADEPILATDNPNHELVGVYSIISNAEVDDMINKAETAEFEKWLDDNKNKYSYDSVNNVYINNDYEEEYDEDSGEYYNNSNDSETYSKDELMRIFREQNYKILYFK